MSCSRGIDSALLAAAAQVRISVRLVGIVASKSKMPGSADKHGGYRESTIWLTAGDLKWDARYRLRLGCIAARQVLLQIAPCAEEARLPAASSRRPPAGAIAAARG